MSPVRIVVADDHPIVREGVVRYIAPLPDIEIVGGFDDAPGAEQAVRTSGAQIAVLDVQMPGMGAGESVARIAESGCAVILFTLRDASDPVVQACAAAGASGYVRKSAPIDELVETIRCVARGERALPENLLQCGSVPPHSALTAREYEVFRHLARCLSPKEAAFAMGVSQSTLYTHANRVRQKLGVQHFSELVQYAERWAIDLDS